MVCYTDLILFCQSVTKQPTLLYLASGGPTWTRQDCLQRNITTSFPRAQLTDAELHINQQSLRQNAAQSGFLNEFTFLKDADGSLLSERFASLAPMAQVCSAYMLETSLIYNVGIIIIIIIIIIMLECVQLR